MYSYPFDLVDPWSNYIHNRINGQRNGNTEITWVLLYLDLIRLICLIRREKSGDVITTSPLP